MIPVGDTGVENHLSRFLDDQIHRLNCLRRLLGKGDGDIGGLLGLVRDPLVAQIPDGKARSDDGDRYAKRTTDE